MAKMTKEEFHDKYFYDIVFDIRDIFSEFLADRENHFADLAKKSIDAFLSELSLLQEKELVPPIESLQISFLHSSFFEKKLCFQLDAYDEIGTMVGKKHLSQQVIDISMETPLQTIEKKWNQWAKDELLDKIITPAYIESLLISVISPVFRFFISKYRYPLEKNFSQSDIETLQLTDKFYVNLGQLNGWKKMIFALRPDRDLLDNKKESLWNFTQYKDKVYTNEVFDGLTISWAKFEHCTFEHCEIKNFSWTDCSFLHCTFHDVKFTDGILYGCFWKQSVILKCEFVVVDFFQTEEAQLTSMERYRPSVMELCHMNASFFYMCRLEEMKLPQSSVTNTELKISGIRASDFESISR